MEGEFMLLPRTRWVSVLVVTLLLSTVAWSQSNTLATINGEVLTEAEVRSRAAAEFEAIDTDRLQFEATIRQREHETLLQALNGIIADQVIQAEAAERKITVNDLLAAEVDANTAEPSQAEMDNIYQLNQQQLAGVSREVGMTQVRQFILEANYDNALEAFVGRLRTQYAVEARLGPYRVDLDLAGHPAAGPEDAPITFVEFSDFECPFCRRTQPVIDRIEEAYGDQVRFVYRQFPLTDIHPRAQKAAEASLCANDQGEFWIMHDALFAEPIELEVASLKFKASNLDLDTDVFGTCLDSGKYAEQVRADLRAGMAAGVTGTPTIYINGRPLGGAQEFAAYAAVIDDELSRIAQ
jgi:protein-disulfide isomerase